MGRDFVEVSRNVHEVRLNFQKAPWEYYALLTTDWHWDNPKTRLDLLKAHLDEAKARDADVFSFGDHFCAMQGKWDKRSSKGEIRPEHQHGDYLDSLVSTGADWLMPYKDILKLVSRGNHETSIRDHHETDLIERLCERIRNNGGVARAGGYTGWVRFVLQNHTRRESKRLWYMHGHGGGGPVTKGVIDFNRYLVNTDADILVTGHVHTKNYVQEVRNYLNDSSVPEQRTIHCVRCSTYKDEYRDGASGFHVEKGRSPRPLGGWWLRLFHAGSDRKVGIEIRDAIA